MMILVTLNMGEISYNDITYYIKKCNNTYMFYLLL